MLFNTRLCSTIAATRGLERGSIPSPLLPGNHRAAQSQPMFFHLAVSSTRLTLALGSYRLPGEAGPFRTVQDLARVVDRTRLEAGEAGILVHHRSLVDLGIHYEAWRLRHKR